MGNRVAISEKHYSHVNPDRAVVRSMLQRFQEQMKSLEETVDDAVGTGQDGDGKAAS